MQFNRPPSHSVDAPIVYIHPADPAWDQDAVSASAEDAEKEGRPDPFIEYCSGRTRFDASGVQCMLGGSPVEFRLRRLSALQLMDVMSLMERDFAQKQVGLRNAYLLAARHGLMSVRQGSADALTLERPGNLTDSDIESLSSTDLGIELVRAIGQAVHMASQPLTDSEKKR